jgi:hypothetical protein
MCLTVLALQRRPQRSSRVFEADPLSVSPTNRNQIVTIGVDAVGHDIINASVCFHPSRAQGMQ